MSVVEIQGVTKRFGETPALDDVTVRIEEGELFALLGPSGSGKTTLLRAIAGFVDPEAGTICIDGDTMHHLPVHRRDIGMVFQHYALFPHMSVFDNVAFGLAVRHVARSETAERVREMLALVQLEGFEGRRPGQLSGGQQQRVALAPRADHPAAGCCSSTSRWGRSTSGCAARCRSSSGRSSARSASRPCSSPTTRKRRSRCPIASRSWTPAGSSSPDRRRRCTSVRRRCLRPTSSATPTSSPRELAATAGCSRPGDASFSAPRHRTAPAARSPWPCARRSCASPGPGSRSPTAPTACPGR